MSICMIICNYMICMHYYILLKEVYTLCYICFVYHSSSDFCELVHFLPAELGQKSGPQDAAGPSRLNLSLSGAWFL